MEETTAAATIAPVGTPCEFLSCARGTIVEEEPVLIVVDCFTAFVDVFEGLADEEVGILGADGALGGLADKMLPPPTGL